MNDFDDQVRDALAEAAQPVAPAPDWDDLTRRIARRACNGDRIAGVRELLTGHRTVGLQIEPPIQIVVGALEVRVALRDLCA